MNRLIARASQQLLAAGLLALCLGGTAHAAFIHVTTGIDEFNDNPSKGCSLREAIQAANTHAAFGGCSAGAVGTNTIILDPGYYSLSRSGANESLNKTGDLDITSDVIIAPFGFANATPDQILIDGLGLDRIFDVRNHAHASFKLMTLINGNPGNQAGGAVRVDHASADFTDCVLRSNWAGSGGAVQVGGAGAHVGFVRTAIVYNTSIYGGGGLYINNDAASASLTASTIAANTAGAGGGGVFVSGVAGAVGVTMNNVTIADNEANKDNANPLGGGGGIEALGGSVNIENSIVADNRSHWTGPDCEGALSVFNYNLISRTDNTCQFPQLTTGNLFDVEPNLAPPFDYGGRTLTLHPRYDSPAIGAGSVAAAGKPGACELLDQRGQVKQNNCDMGAVQWHMDFTLDRDDDAVDDNPGDGICHAPNGGCTLRAAIMEANARSCAAGFCSILLDARPYLLSLQGAGDSAGDLNMHAPMNLFGTLAGNGTSVVDANLIDRAFDIDTTAALVDLDITNASASGAGGGVRVEWPGDVRLSHVRIYNNKAASGGGIYLKQGNVQADHCVISGNVTFGGVGGGVFVDDDPNGISAFSLDNCTIGNNAAAGDGGGLYVGNNRAALGFVTLAFNSSSVGTVGGIKNNGGTVGLNNSIIADNSYLPLGSNTPAPSDCAGTFDVYNINLVQTQKYCTLNGLTPPIAGDPYLQRPHNVIEDFYKLIPSSPAYRAVPEAECRGFGYPLEISDQVDAVRAAGFFGFLAPLYCSLGAYEGIEDHIFANGFEQPI